MCVVADALVSASLDHVASSTSALLKTIVMISLAWPDPGRVWPRETNSPFTLGIRTVPEPFYCLV